MNAEQIIIEAISLPLEQRARVVQHLADIDANVCQE